MHSWGLGESNRLCQTKGDLKVQGKSRQGLSAEVEWKTFSYCVEINWNRGNRNGKKKKRMMKLNLLIGLSLHQFLLLTIPKVSFLKQNWTESLFCKKKKMLSESPLPIKFHNLGFRTLTVCLQSIVPDSPVTLSPEVVFPALPYTSAASCSNPSSFKKPASAPDGEIEESRKCVLNFWTMSRSLTWCRAPC